MPRKSTGGASTSASTPGTPASKPPGPRKSLTAAADDAESSTTGSNPLIIDPATKSVLKQQETALKSSGIENYELPRTQVIKVAKSDIPDSVQLRKEVQQALVKSASVFISYLTATAHDKATGKGGKIISANHVLEAWKELDLGDEGSAKELREQLGEYRKTIQRKKEAAKAKGKDAEADDADISRVAGEDEDEDEAEGDETRAGNEGDEDGGDGSMLKKSLMNGGRHADEDEEDDEEGEDQLMDED